MGFLGMRGTGDWVVDQRPKNWRQQIMYLSPNGKAPLTAILSMIGNESTTDPEFNWWESESGAVYTAITAGDVFTLPDMSVAYAGGGAISDTYYIRVPAAFATQCRVGHQLMTRDDSDPTNDVIGKCTQVDVNGANSIVGFRLLEADDNGAGGNDMQTADYLLIVGSLHAEGAEMPDAVNKDPVKIYNYTQIFRTALSVTGTAIETTLRTENEYQKQKRERLEQHSIEMEMAFLFGIMTENVGQNGKPERTTRGVVTFIRQYAAANVSHYPTSAIGVGSNWTVAGENWLNTSLEGIFRYGADEKLALCGSQTMLGIQRLALSGGQMNLAPKMNAAYGLQVVTWISPWGQIHFKTHPLMSQNPTFRDAAIILEPKEIKYRNVPNRDTKFYPDKDSGRGRIDGKDEEWLTEAGLEMHHPLKMGYLTGFNVDG
jgi:hypothetical protein